MNRKKKTTINVITSFFHQIVLFVCGLITPRLILRAFGSSYNGVISSATQLLSMVSFLTLGVAGALRSELYHSLAANDYEETSRTMKAANNYMRKVGLAVIVYAVILMIIFPYISTSDLSNVECAVIIGIISIDTFALYFFGTANYSLLVADQKVYIKSLVAAGVTVLNTIAVALVIRGGGNIFAVKGTSALVYAITPISIAIYVKNHYRLDTKCEPRKDALKKKNDAAIHSVANIVHDNTDTLILTLFMDIKFVSVYTIYYAIVGKIKTLIKETGTGIEAALGNMWAKNERETLAKTFRTYEFGMSSFVVLVFSCIGVLLVPFIELYTAKVTDINYLRPDFALIITAAEAVFCIRQPYRSLVHVTGFFKETKNAAIIEAVLNLTVSISLVKFLGLNGVAVGTLIANLYRTLSYSRFVSSQILRRDYGQVIKRILWTAVGMGISIAVASVTLNVVPVSGWIGWIIKGIIAFGISSVVVLMMAFLFYRRDLAALIRYIKKR